MKIKNGVLAFLFICTSVSGQHLKNCESKLKDLFGKIEQYSAYYHQEKEEENSSDSLAKYNAAFEKTLLQCTTQNPETIKAPFKELDTMGLTILTSPDGNFRIYSWDKQDGGTMHNFRNLFQYKADGKTISKLETIMEENVEIEPEPGRLFFDVNEVVSEGKKYYLASSVGVYSSAASDHSIKVYTIENGTINDHAVLIKTQSGIRNQLSYSIDLTDAANANLELSDYTELRIQYDKKTKTILLPLINANGGWTKKKIKYQFDGNYFKKVK